MGRRNDCFQSPTLGFFPSLSDTTPPQTYKIGKDVARHTDVKVFASAQERLTECYRLLESYSTLTTAEHKRPVAEFYLVMGTTLTEVGDYQKAIETYDKLLSTFRPLIGHDLHDVFARAFAHKGYALDCRGQYVDSKESYAEVLKLQSDNFFPKALAAAAYSWNRLSSANKAVDVYNLISSKLERLQDNDSLEDYASSLLNAAIILTDKCDFNKAVTLYDKVIQVSGRTSRQLHKLSLWALHGKASALFRYGSSTGSLELCDKLLRLTDPDACAFREIRASTFLIKARCHLVRNESSLALKTCSKAIAAQCKFSEPSIEYRTVQTKLLKAEILWEHNDYSSSKKLCDEITAPIWRFKFRSLEQIVQSAHKIKLSFDMEPDKLASRSYVELIHADSSHFMLQSSYKKTPVPDVVAETPAEYLSRVTGLQIADAEQALRELKARAAHQDPAKSPRLKWGKDNRLGENPAAFALRAYHLESKAGILHRGLLAKEDKPLATKLASWLRFHKMPPGVDIPTLPEWNTRQLAKLPSLLEAQSTHEAFRLDAIHRTRKRREPRSNAS